MTAVLTTEQKPLAEPKPWRVLVVDDHQLFRDGLTDLIASNPETEVCGQASNYAEALEKFRVLKPNLVTVDISLSTGNGLDLVERIKALEPSTLVLVVSMFEEGVYGDRALAAGASGYVSKQASNEEIQTALQTLCRQSAYFSPNMTKRLLQRRALGKSDTGAAEEAHLSTRELQIFTLIGQGETTQKIAKSLHLSTSTVETYRERIKSKLNLASGAELTRRAILWVMHHS